jgi:hypothetical protein
MVGKCRDYPNRGLSPNSEDETIHRFHSAAKPQPQEGLSADFAGRRSHNHIVLVLVLELVLETDRSTGLNC